MTLKKTNFNPLVKELLWFLRGETNTKTLGAKIWDEWADANGDLGPIYGKQWRKWKAPKGHIDQLGDVISRIKGAILSNTNDRRLLVNAWNVEELPQMALAPCHVMFQFSLMKMDFVERQQFAPQECKDRIRLYPESHPDEIMNDYEVPKFYLSTQLYQRSADVGLGVPFNIASYALLTHMVAQVTNTVPGEFIHTFGDVHIYDDHIEGLKEALSREDYPLPKLQLNPAIRDIDLFRYEDVRVIDYVSHPAINLKVAV